VVRPEEALMATEMNFQTWLQRRAREVNQPERLRRRSEWIAALDQFREQVTSWIRESDPEGLLIIERMEIERTEPRLGTYTAPALKISLGDAAVRVVPMGRDVRGSYRNEEGTECPYEGRVDITDGLRKYVLYRVADDEGLQGWVVSGDSGSPKRFDRAQLEAILWDLLS
jgi:hypothetical protein